MTEVLISNVLTPPFIHFLCWKPFIIHNSCKERPISSYTQVSGGLEQFYWKPKQRRETKTVVCPPRKWPFFFLALKHLDHLFSWRLNSSSATCLAPEGLTFVCYLIWGQEWILIQVELCLGADSFSSHILRGVWGPLQWVLGRGAAPPAAEMEIMHCKYVSRATREPAAVSTSC